MRLFISLCLITLAASAAEPDAKTVRLFKAKCASCHGADGKADTDTGKKLKILDMTTAAFQKKDDAEFRKAILEGVKKDGKDGMDAYKDVLTPEQIDVLIARVRAFATK